MKLALATVIAHGFPVGPDFLLSFEIMKQHLQSGAANAYLPEHLRVSSVSLMQNTQFPIDVARNTVCADFLKSDADYLFFADCDHVFEEDTIGRLLARDKAVITGRYHMRKPPYHPVAYVKHPIFEGPHAYQAVHFGTGCFEIERGGAGCLLIRRDVIEAIYARIGHNWFRYQRGPEATHDFTVSEDFWFYRQAREAGFPCWMDWEVEAKHLQLMPIDRSFNAEFLKRQVDALSRMSSDERQRVLDGFIACGFPEGYQLESGDVVPAYTYSPGER